MALQRSAGNAAVQRLAASHRASSRQLQRSIMVGSGSSAPEIPQQRDFSAIVAEYRLMLEAGRISAADRAEAEAAIAKANEELRRHRTLGSRGTTAASVAGGGVVLAGTLAVDDVTVIGVADDVAIPFVLLAAGLAAAYMWAVTPGAEERARSLDAAQRAVVDAIKTLGGIVLAAKVGDQIRSWTEQLAIHLARLLGTTVSGMPPDHQQDPDRDRPHWWKEIKNLINQIRDKGLTPKQLWRELGKKFTAEQLREILDALRRAAERMGEDPPDFPPIAFP